MHIIGNVLIGDCSGGIEIRSSENERTIRIQSNATRLPLSTWQRVCVAARAAVAVFRETSV